MPGFDGTGPMGMGPMTGGGRGFCSPWGLGAARRYGSRRWPGYAYPYYAPQPFLPGAVPPRMSRGQEMDFLKDEAESLRRTLEDIDARIKELAGESV
ncbi:MAG: DUF5320 domain-containing protein [Dehalococcoidia bacterium]|nr:DUF5320 domain-containing protein [Dehalococcoidia bacterium]